MAADYDLVLRGGTIVDGTGASRRTGDVAIIGERIVQVGAVAGRGAEEIDAAGLVVTPGFIDLHTHYDGQATWESTLAPSSNHGVTTVLTGNCGVGFAPCRPDDRQRLVKLMEGVEDVPEVVMTEGLPWSWESFPDYLDTLAARSLDIDVATMIPHSALRVYVMGERGARREPATAADRAQMTQLVEQAVRSGAWGVATSRLLFHRSADGSYIPSLGSATDELKALAAGLERAEAGVFQLVPDVPGDIDQEFALMRDIAATCGRPLSFTLAQTVGNPDGWRRSLAALAEADAAGLTMRGQVFPRPVGMLLGLDLSYNPLSRRPSWRAIAGLVLPDKVAALRDPAFRARILAEEDAPHVLPGINSTLDRLGDMTVLEDRPNYLPRAEDTLACLAREAGRDLMDYALDRMLERDGARILYLPASNYVDHDATAIEHFLRDSSCLLGLGDGGAHYGLICDASFPTTLLTEWVRERGTLSLEAAIAKLATEPADFLGLVDRGRVAPGQLADLNLIDLDRLALHPPRVAYDLPAGGRRLRQDADGYVTTIKRGVATYRNGSHTGALPGRLVRNMTEDAA